MQILPYFHITFFSACKIRPVIDRRYPLDQIADAHRYVEKGLKREMSSLLSNTTVNGGQPFFTAGMKRDKIFFIKFQSFYTCMVEKVDLESLLTMFGKLNETPGYYMMQAVQKWDREIDRILDGLDTTRTQLVLLTALVKLSKAGKPVTQKDVADFVRRDQNTVSAVMRTLEKKGQVTRLSTEDDLRAKYIAITGRGLSLVEQATGQILIMNRQLFPDVNDNKELIRLSLKYI